MKKADVDVPKVRSCYVQPNVLLPLHYGFSGGFLVEREFTPLTLPPPIWKGVDLQVVY